MKEKIWLYFILLQPILDLLTSLMVNKTTLPVSVGILVRVVFLVCIVVFVLRYFINHKQFKPLIGIGFLAVFILLHLGINFISKEPFSLVSEVTFLTKALYPIFVFIAFYILYRGKEISRSKLLKALSFNTIVVSAIIVIPTILGISFESYNSSFAGSIGWFNAANETGAILTILFSFTLLLYFESLNWSALPLTAIVGTTVAVYLIGTKVATGSYILIAVFALALFLLKKQWVKSAVMLVALAGILYGVNQSPVAENTKIAEEQTQMRQELYQEADKHYTKEQVQNIMMFQDYREMSHPIITRILSSRDLFLLMHYDYFEEAEMSRKLFGMGYASEYHREAKMIEMDYFDFVFSFGVIAGLGLTVLMAIVVFKTIKFIFIELFNKQRNSGKMLIAFCSLLMLGVSFVAGHIWFAPAVSFYYAMLLAMLFSNDATTTTAEST